MTVDTCPERMNVVETAARMQPAARMQAADTCPERMHAEAVLTMRRFFWCTGKKRNKKKQEARSKAAVEC